ncbi:MAG: hypothetical protein EBQ96_05695 [Proteobacteria bacterium]|nr:hypothetical protein [Pseudomonadota bacterium]
MLEKHRKLILSQVSALMGFGACVLGFLRYQQSQNITEPLTMGFILFAIVLFAIEIRLVIGWLQDRKKLKP